jgi:hypothetical protein
VGVRGSEGLVKGCVGPLGDAPSFRNAPPRRRGRVPSLGSPPNSMSPQSSRLLPS